MANTTQGWRAALLLKSTEKGQLWWMRLALWLGADVNAVSRWGHKTALMMATWNQDLAAMQLLWDAGADVNFTNTWGHTALMDAVNYGGPLAMHWLLDKGANANTVDRASNSALMMAKKEGDEKKVALLEMYGATR